MTNNFNDMFQKLQGMGMQGNQNGIPMDPNQIFMQNFVSNNPQFQQYQNMMNMMNGKGNFNAQQFGGNNMPFNNPLFNNAQPQQGEQSQSAPFPNFQNQQGIDPSMIMNMMNNMKQNQNTAPVKTGAVKRNYFGLTPILAFANKDIIYSLTMYFARK